MQPKINTAHLIRSTGILMAAFLANKVLAIGRQIVIARAFGTGGDYDAFVAAFRLPDILLMLISGGALATAFIPVLSERLTLHPIGDPDGWNVHVSGGDAEANIRFGDVVGFVGIAPVLGHAKEVQPERYVAG